MRFEWDQAKNLSNRHKHGVSFEAAATVFADPNALSELDRDSFEEPRWRTIGRSEVGTPLFVIHALRDMIDDELVIRIISARRASPSESRRYEREASYR